jgi:hypothetical protein
MSSAAASTQLGSFNERGIIKNFERKGFTPGKCLCELVANSLDAMFYAVDRDNRPLPRVQNPKIEFRVTAEYIDIVDNGYGMTLERVRNMLDLNRENHGNHKALGVSGFGFKPATMILSEKSEIYVYTKVLDGESLRVTIPWDQIYASGKYIDMSSCEPALFPEEYTAMEMGTILRFPYLPSLENIIHANFMDKSVAVLDRMAVIFGHFQVDIIYSNNIKYPNRPIVLEKYNYFSGNPSTDFYTGQIYEDLIHQYKNNTGEQLFLWENSVDDKTYYIPKSGKGFSKDAKPYTSNMAGWELVGEYLVQTGMRVKPEYFDIHNPRIPSQQARFMSEYDKRLIGDIDVDDSGNNNNKKNKKNTAKGDQFDFMAKCKFARTKQLIGCFEWANSKTASARSGVRGTHDGFHTNCYLSYNPNSSSDNIQDITMGIQENKNQYTGEAIPLNMKRLVETIRNKTADIIWEYFEELVGDDKPEPDSSLNDLYGDVDDDASSDVASIDEVDSDVGIISSSTASDDDNSVSSEAPSSSASEASVVPSNVVPSSSTATTHSDDNTASSKSAASTSVSASATPSSSESAAASVVPSSTSDDDIDESMFTNVPVIDHTRILIPRELGVKMLRKLMPYAEEVYEAIIEILCKINDKEGDKILKETFKIMCMGHPERLIITLQHLYEHKYSENENVKCGTTLFVLYNRYIMKK